MLIEQIERLEEQIDQERGENTPPEEIPIPPPPETPPNLPVVETIPCDQVTTFKGEKMYDVSYKVELGNATGTTPVLFDASNVPDRFIVYYDNRIVIDTDYIGSRDFNSGGPQRGQFNLSITNKIEPITGKKYPDRSIPNTDSHGYPYVKTPSANAGEFSTSFNKNKADVTTAIVRVFAPTEDTYWEFSMGCPPNSNN